MRITLFQAPAGRNVEVWWTFPHYAPLGLKPIRTIQLPTLRPSGASNINFQFAVLLGNLNNTLRISVPLWFHHIFG